MIDAEKITDYNLNNAELEEHILFWVCAAGKNGVTSAKCLDNLLVFLKKLHKSKSSPFKLIKKTGPEELASYMKQFGIGCYNLKSKTFLALANSNLNLNECSVEDLELIKGIGPKTARCFLIHSRPDQPYAGLDTHILRFLRDKGYDAPKSTPTGKKYRELEKIFIRLAKRANKSVADYDLFIWNKYRKKVS
jgi:thermostable 8-oxoguanine DNA glycosylase